ncbi:DUF2569 family protein [Bartonella sp. HY761]|uniref:DUF2569 family protein n=1 Tax=Bartonella sp. HY761 TaxID=2979330 RepID=UPI0021FC9B9C|nr:DUF2569 family protein [Bartonella sp. HY761]UXN06417.1 DUF2569 domain-containing protein [Bartonella sp. HY761]
MNVSSNLVVKNKLQKSDPKIGGLLYLVAIYLTYHVVYNVSYILNKVQFIYNFDSFTQVLVSFLSAPFLFDLVLMTMAFIGLLKEKRTFPYVFIAFLIYRICLDVGYALFFKYRFKKDEVFTSPIYWLGCFIAVIFLFYIIFSKRVKNTFVN